MSNIFRRYWVSRLFNSRNQTFSDGDTSRAAALLAAVARSFEIAQPFFTRKDVRREGSIHTLSRIDRVFVNLPMADLRDFQCHSHTIGTIGDRSVPSIDHTPVRLVIECSRSEHMNHPVIRRWPTQHPLFICALDVEHRNKLYDVDPFIALDQFRACAKGRQATSDQHSDHPWG